MGPQMSQITQRTQWNLADPGTPSERQKKVGHRLIDAETGGTSEGLLWSRGAEGAEDLPEPGTSSEWISQITQRVFVFFCGLCDICGLTS
jgi:hypothetical protein